MSLKEYLKKFWWIILISIFFMIGAYYVIFFRSTKNAASTIYFTRETTVARAAANNLESFFEIIGNSVALQAKVDVSQISNPKFIEDGLNTYLRQWSDSGLVAGIVMTDDKGIVTYNVNTTGVSGVGADVSDREYFKWAKSTNSDKYFVGDPIVSKLGASEGRTIIPVAAAVKNNDNFYGVLVSAVKLDPINKRFLSMMQISDKTDVYLIDENKNVIYQSGGGSQLDSSLKDIIYASTEGNAKIGDKLVAFSPVELDGKRWMFILSSPYSEAGRIVIPYYMRQVAALLLAALMTLIFGLYVSKESK